MLSSPEPDDPQRESAKYARALYMAAHGGRTFVDPDSRQAWSVFEVDAAGVPGAGDRARCLVFVRDEAVRRVWEYPDSWYLLDDADLAALSWGV